MRWPLAGAYTPISSLRPPRGSRLTRDSWVSVMYAEELNSAKSSVNLQRTDRHGMLGQKPSHFQVSLCQRHAERSPPRPADEAFQEQYPSSQTRDGTPRPPSRVLVLGNRRRPPLVPPPRGGHALYLRPQMRRGGGDHPRVFCPSSPGDACGLFAECLARFNGRLGTSDP